MKKKLQMNISQNIAPLFSGLYPCSTMPVNTLYVHSAALFLNFSLYPPPPRKSLKINVLSTNSRILNLLGFENLTGLTTVIAGLTRNPLSIFSFINIMRTFKTNSLICAVILWSLTAAAAQNFVFAAVQKLTFEDTPTAIQTPSVASQTSLIYFNSQSKEIVIESTKAIGNVAIYDLTGRVVNIPFFKKMEYLTTIDVSHLPAGVYIVKTAADVKKLIINH
jgi:hypothetical protein